LFIIAVVLVCIYGIIGIPKSGADIVKNFRNNIHLGLDLKGGTLLVVQVQLQDAFKAIADNNIDRMKEELKKANIEAAGDITRNDPNRVEDADKIEIDIKGIRPRRPPIFGGWSPTTFRIGRSTPSRAVRPITA
jgi:preprotein translocase subunit SecD